MEGQTNSPLSQVDPEILATLSQYPTDVLESLGGLSKEDLAKLLDNFDRVGRESGVDPEAAYKAVLEKAAEEQKKQAGFWGTVRTTLDAPIKLWHVGLVALVIGGGFLLTWLVGEAFDLNIPLFHPKKDMPQLTDGCDVMID